MINYAANINKWVFTSVQNVVSKVWLLYMQVLIQKLNWVTIVKAMSI